MFYKKFKNVSAKLKKVGNARFFFNFSGLLKMYITYIIIL